ncbi:IS701 family transposase [Actinorugispora endophytica]|uniref:SRSO17 transposase n=1 Tax=Actinorugispora endophytica TaxID=1605990 RepID=A0A4R6UMV2_9ACTN|nr:IS701 family transposase [Actinorugispora endophytica]TDQ46909.1 SRSO17 transposase [Actinorugispora endophytica]
MRQEELEKFCDDLFAVLPRRDQRRWAHTYVRGLVGCEGKKSIQSMSSMVGERCADQSLQQFVNQSTWQWEPVRRRLAEHVAARTRLCAWTINEVVFPKTGQYSVGVDYQYAGSLGRAVNCQLGLTLSYVTDIGAMPLDWRLMLPKAWDDDDARRRKAYLPDHERHRPPWCELLALVDEVIGEWGLPSAPLVADLRHCSGIEELTAALNDRGVGYLLRVGSGFTARMGASPDPVQRPGSVAVRRPRPLSGPHRVSALAESLSGQSRQVVRRAREGAGHESWSQFVTAPIRPELPAGRAPARRGLGAMIRLLLQWPRGRRHPQAYWVTNQSDAALEELLTLWQRRLMAERHLRLMRANFGLTDFEGRSYRGWHHHVTLVAIAHAYAVLYGVEPARALLDATAETS